MQKISELEITTDSISATVEQNQIYNNQQISSLSSKITQTAESITSEVSRATQAEDTLSSRITQNADEINLRVQKGNVSSEISQEAGKISIKSNRFSLQSTNCTISEDGTIKATNAELSGKIISSSGKIGGFNIGEKSLCALKGSSTENAYLGMPGVYVGEDGFSCNGLFGSSIIKEDGSATFSTSEDYGIKISNKYDSSDYLLIKPKMIKIYDSASYYTEYSTDGIRSSSKFSIEATTINIGRNINKLAFFDGSGSIRKSVSTISSTSSATASSCATKINEILTALKAYNLIG